MAKIYCYRISKETQLNACRMISFIWEENVLNVYQLHQNSEHKTKELQKNPDDKRGKNSALIKRWVLCKVDTWTTKMKLQNYLISQRTCRIKAKTLGKPTKTYK